MQNTISELVKVIRDVMAVENPSKEIQSRINNILDAVEGTKGKQSKELVEFIKKNVKGRRQKVAVLYAKLGSDNIVRIGWSKTNTKLKDAFNKDVGLALAKERSMLVQNAKVPTSIGKKYRNFKSRCARYFKGAIVPLGCGKEGFVPVSPSSSTFNEYERELAKVLERFGAEA